MSATLTDRVIAAYYRSRIQDGAEIIDQPNNSSGVTGHDGLTYVVLQNASGTLAVYRVRGSGALKELHRWPREVAPCMSTRRRQAGQREAVVAVPDHVTPEWAETETTRLILAQWAVYKEQARDRALTAAERDILRDLGELALLSMDLRGRGREHALSYHSRKKLRARLLQFWTQDELDTARSAALRGRS
jgi:hypothetical protein